MSKSVDPQKKSKRTVDRPAIDQWLALTAQLKPIPGKMSAAQIIRELRDGK
jgi:hypothetical protein